MQKCVCICFVLSMITENISDKETRAHKLLKFSTAEDTKSII